MAKFWLTLLFLVVLTPVSLVWKLLGRATDAELTALESQLNRRPLLKLTFGGAMGLFALALKPLSWPAAAVARASAAASRSPRAARTSCSRA